MLFLRIKLLLSGLAASTWWAILLALHLIFWDRVSLRLEHNDSDDWFVQQATGILLSPPHPHAVITDRSHHTQILWEFYLVSHACAAGILPFEPSPQPKTDIWFLMRVQEAEILSSWDHIDCICLPKTIWVPGACEHPGWAFSAQKEI